MDLPADSTDVVEPAEEPMADPSARGSPQWDPHPSVAFHHHRLVHSVVVVEEEEVDLGP